MTSVWNKGISGARRRLQAARYAFRRHTEDCVLWDYESDNGCPDCQHTRDDVATAKFLLRNMEDPAVTAWKREATPPGA